MLTVQGFQKALEYWKLFLQGVVCTVSLSALTVIFGFILALILAICRMGRSRILKAIATVYVELFRAPAVVALSLNSGAYLSEIIRSGIQSIDIGQTEASRSLGLSSVKTMRFVILPQAIKNILPAIANEFVTIIKESAICYTIGVQDIMSAVNAVKGATYRMAEALIIATVLYFCLTYPTSKVIAHFERKMSAGDKR